MDNDQQAADGDRPTGATVHDISQRQAPAHLSHIKGWGADLDRRNRPAYPKERTPPRLEGLHWTDAGQQPRHIQVFHSTERPGITPVFGTSAPPRGLSGKLREIAYRLSENDIRHWLLLLFADRVNVVEGIGDDLRQGHVPNVFAEMGGKSELQYNRKGFVTKVAVISLAVGLGYLLLTRRRRTETEALADYDDA